MKSKINIPLILITLVAGILRFTCLSSFPSGFSMDEAAKGYNAYSLLKTGKSFRGLSWPLYFTDFSDKLPTPAIFYNYAVIPFVAVLGLNETAVRLPAAVAGTLTVVVLYYLTQRLFRKRTISYLTAFFLTISPWHIILSRVGIEPVTFPLFFLSGWYLLEKSVPNRNKFFYLGTAVLALSLYTYQAAFIIVPLFILVFVAIRRDYFSNRKRLLLLSAVLSVIISGPLVYLYIAGVPIIEHYHELAGQSGLLGSKVMVLYLITAFCEIFFPCLVFMYLLPIGFLANLGLLKMFRAAKSNPTILTIIITFFISLIPAAITPLRTSFLQSATRTVGRIGYIEILAAYFYWRITTGRIGLKKILLPAIFLITSGVNVIFLFKIGYPYYYPDLWLQFGFKQLTSYLTTVENKYQKIYITDKANQPFIYILFYQKYDPEKFQNETVVRKYQNSRHPYEIVEGFDKYVFCNIDECWNPEKGNLFVARENELTSILEGLKFSNPSGESFRIIEN
jgi:4-amino-4-deoxy-L-arabinose transferase-like glycosyltransferase